MYLELQNASINKMNKSFYCTQELNQQITKEDVRLVIN